MSELNQVRVGIDIGGTFTDIVVQTGTRSVVAKVPSSREDPSIAIPAALAAAARKAQVDLRIVSALAHGTTAATNAVIERRLATVGLLTTKGFRDVLAIGRQTRGELYNFAFAPRWIPVPRHLRREVAERIDYAGNVLIRPEKNAVLKQAADLVSADVDVICVAFLHSYVNDAHELLVADWLREAYPDVLVRASCEVVREFREYERFSTAVLDAALGPMMSRYLTNFTVRAADAGVHPEPYLMQSAGGIATMDEAAARPTCTLLSGPAAGVLGAIHVATAVGRADLLTFDMGGTSADLGVVLGGAAGKVGVRIFDDLPILGTSLDIHTIGAGGGSIAWIDAGGRLQVGPRSAGSNPGPAAYGHGGEEATVTDAYVATGLLPENLVLGESVTVNREKACVAIDRSVGIPLGLSTIAAAHAILDVVNTNMALAARQVTVARGIDPRDLSIVAYGGAGPIHGVALARELGIAEVIIPEHPGTLSALGLLVSDLETEFAQSYVNVVNSSTMSTIEAVAKRLSDEAASWRINHKEEGTFSIKYSADMRYHGQDHALRIDLPPMPWTDETVEAITKKFGETHRTLNGYDVEGEILEVVTLRAVAIIEVGARGSAIDVSSGAVGDQHLEVGDNIDSDVFVWWDANGPRQTKVLRRENLAQGRRYEGPAILIQNDATCAVPPGAQLEVPQSGSAIILHTEIEG